MTTVTLITSKMIRGDGDDVRPLQYVSDEKTQYIQEHNSQLHGKFFGPWLQKFNSKSCMLYRDWKKGGNALRVSMYNDAPQKLTEVSVRLDPTEISNPDEAWKTLHGVCDLILNSFWTSSLIERDLYTYIHALYLRDCGDGIICVPEIIVKGKPMLEIGNMPITGFNTIICGPGTKTQHGQWGVRLYYYVLWDGYLHGDIKRYKEMVNTAKEIHTYLSHPDLLSRVPDICAKSIHKCECLMAYAKEYEREEANDIPPSSPTNKEEPTQENHITVSPTKGEIEKAADVLLNKLLERNSITKVIPILECALKEAKLRK